MNNEYCMMQPSCHSCLEKHNCEAFKGEKFNTWKQRHKRKGKPLFSNTAKK